MDKKNKGLFFALSFSVLCILLILSNIFVSSQSTQHGINGYVFDAPGNISANGASVAFWLYYPNGTTLKNPIQLYDIVGPSGLSGISNWYSQDANNFKNPYWSAGDIVVIQIVKDINRAINTSVILSSIGNNQAPTVTLPGFCGDTFCSTGENCSTCAQDCLICGDGSCSIECGENSTTCLLDCPIVCSYCGNGVCDSSRNETADNCIFDCHCGNSICDSTYNETILGCESDCHCGDGVCNYGENVTSCSSDCHCGNKICELDEDYDFCPEDCPFAICGNGLCDPGETLINCQQDCGGQECNNNLICDFGENNQNCPNDCIKLSCGNGVCDANKNETYNNCPTECINSDLNVSQQVKCGDKICSYDEGEDYKNCPYDCYKEQAKCGDKKCEYAENQNNCCLDCGCQKDNSCVKNSCEKTCCFLGVCKSELGICWYGYLFALIGVIFGLLLYFFYRR